MTNKIGFGVAFSRLERIKTDPDLGLRDAEDLAVGVLLDLIGEEAVGEAFRDAVTARLAEDHPAHGRD